MTQIKGSGTRHVSLILERSLDLSEVRVRVKMTNGDFVKYLLNETEYFSSVNPGVSLRETPLKTIAKELGSLMVVFQD